jgi:hypothetical protein
MAPATYIRDRKYTRNASGSLVILFSFDTLFTAPHEKRVRDYKEASRLCHHTALNILENRLIEELAVFTFLH